MSEEAKKSTFRCKVRQFEMRGSDSDVECRNPFSLDFYMPPVAIACNPSGCIMQGSTGLACRKSGNREPLYQHFHAAAVTVSPSVALFSGFGAKSFATL